MNASAPHGVALTNGNGNGNGGSDQPFTDVLWDGVGELFQTILAHPFNAELLAGTLAPERFRCYIVQDAQYLLEFAKALALVAGRFLTADDVLLFVDLARSAVVVERLLHQHYFQLFGVSRESASSAELTPASTFYTSFLLSYATTRSLEEALAALLPCFVVYERVGTHIFHASEKVKDGPRPPNPYAKWIETYAGEEFRQSVRKMESVVNRVAASASAEVRGRMAQAFRQACHLELLFWDRAYARESWASFLTTISGTQHNTQEIK